jgi:hypothetical protein
MRNGDAHNLLFQALVKSQDQPSSTTTVFASPITKPTFKTTSDRVQQLLPILAFDRFLLLDPFISKQDPQSERSLLCI